MSIKKIVVSQYQGIVNSTANQSRGISTPTEGWVRTVRKALNMSGAQLAKRMKVTRARVQKIETAELDSAVTLKTMQCTAQAMGCRFVYAIVPEQEIENLISEQARKKAEALVHTTNTHMALEAQTLPNEKVNYEIERLTQEILNKMPMDFWDEIKGDK